ncbi:MAG: hypothetical protein IKH14_08430 [Prevotella sp.]|nr:hypothetical protein [Prevotella sp.]MBR3445869.1 hypothetical protein [Prevotella sp.]
MLLALSLMILLISVIAFLVIIILAIFKKSVVKYLTWVVLAMLISAIGIYFGEQYDDYKWKENKEREELEYAQKCSTIEGVSQLLEGSVWTYTDYIGEDDKFNVWCKLEFKNDKLYYYEVSPSEGEWGEPQVCDYSIEERRYSNTGNKYIGIFWESLLMKYSFVPSEKSISYQGRNGYVFGAYLTMKDVNPWY